MQKTQFVQSWALSFLSLSLLVGSQVHAATGATIYASNCAGCHATGVLGAPKLDKPAEWEARRAGGVDVLVKNAIGGINNMPPRGGNPKLNDAEIRSVVEYMLSKVDEAAPPKKAAVAPTPQSAAAPAPQKPATKAPAMSPPPAVKRVAEVAKPKKKKVTQRRQRAVNSFNRLMKPPSERNLPPMRDGIHDPTGDGTAALQHPKEAFAPMPKANSGNRVDWVAALEKGDIQPRFNLEDEGKAPIVLDLNIVREVKGSMPDVVYPHKQHTEWLDCSNCHPSIFIPKKGANNISMASILLGKQCGVCHGKVAFPVSECRKCHSKNKQTAARK